MKDRFFQRYVKEDGKGIYVHYGSSRLRPTKKSKLEKGMEVSMIFTDFEKGFYQAPLRMYVFNNLEEYEIWKTKS